MSALILLWKWVWLLPFTWFLTAVVHNVLRKGEQNTGTEQVKWLLVPLCFEELASSV